MTSTSSLVFTALCQAGWYIGQALLSWRPAKRWFGESAGVLNLVLAFLLGNTTLIMLSYLLDIFSVFFRPALWSLWMALGLGANLVCRCASASPDDWAAETMARSRLVQATGCHLLFLPAYSPNFNPIEHLWATLKTRLRKALATAADPFLFIANMCLCYCYFRNYSMDHRAFMLGVISLRSIFKVARLSSQSW